MPALKLDGAGAQKMKTLEEALITLQQIHGLVERMAMEMKNQKPAGVIPMQIKRAATPLVGQLKGQFGLIADQVSAMILVAGRGGGDQVKLRAYREYVAQLRTAIDMAQSKVKKDHGVVIEIAPE
ncbi:MAG: hypothetical protein H3C62_02080 [Gemmatimonadaceae bacterium]|nr:hypothetical protein [Gemmatimonadaceae bacterium]